jgi:hypothetical protein
MVREIKQDNKAKIKERNERKRKLTMNGKKLV